MNTGQEYPRVLYEHDEILYRDFNDYLGRLGTALLDAALSTEDEREMVEHAHMLVDQFQTELDQRLEKTIGRRNAREIKARLRVENPSDKELAVGLSDNIAELRGRMESQMTRTDVHYAPPYVPLLADILKELDELATKLVEIMDSNQLDETRLLYSQLTKLQFLAQQASDQIVFASAGGEILVEVAQGLSEQAEIVRTELDSMMDSLPIWTELWEVW